MHLLKIRLQSRIMDQGKIENSVTGVTQGSVLSPILLNIYMFEFDPFMEKQIIPQETNIKFTTRQLARRFESERIEFAEK